MAGGPAIVHAVLGKLTECHLEPFITDMDAAQSSCHVTLVRITNHGPVDFLIMLTSCEGAIESFSIGNTNQGTSYCIVTCEADGCENSHLGLFILQARKNHIASTTLDCSCQPIPTATLHHGV